MASKVADGAAAGHALQNVVFPPKPGPHPPAPTPPKKTRTRTCGAALTMGNLTYHCTLEQGHDGNHQEQGFTVNNGRVMEYNVDWLPRSALQLRVAP